MRGCRGSLFIGDSGIAPPPHSPLCVPSTETLRVAPVQTQVRVRMRRESAARRRTRLAMPEDTSEMCSTEDRWLLLTALPLPL